ncbi:unnamed protein product [Adineta ricciae]|uniref:Uncharacterized protein n=1 Tax=Adineta ricciae TaxID=249248 RepID=A0A815RBB2_ADIRI|nr:unnamed protein product [Adineta ricciae]CAF1474810.1 unnamed protein product [Adineta ricciae]
MVLYNHKLKNTTHLRDNSDRLIMCIPGCGGTRKSQLIRAVTDYFRVTNRIQKIRKLAAAEIGGMAIHSFLGEQLIDEMSTVGLTLLGKLNTCRSANSIRWYKRDILW